MILSQKLPRHTCLIFAFTSHFVHCVPLLTPVLFRIPKRKKENFQEQRAFSPLGPVTWNKLPYSVRHSQTKSQFTTQLKTTIFHTVSKRNSEILSVFAAHLAVSLLNATCDVCEWVGERKSVCGGGWGGLGGCVLWCYFVSVCSHFFAPWAVFCCCCCFFSSYLIHSRNVQYYHYHWGQLMPNLGQLLPSLGQLLTNHKGFRAATHTSSVREPIRTT